MKRNLAVFLLLLLTEAVLAQNQGQFLRDDHNWATALTASSTNTFVNTNETRNVYPTGTWVFTNNNNAVIYFGSGNSTNGYISNGVVVMQKFADTGVTSALLKTDGSGNIQAAVAGTDYAAPISAGTNIVISGSTVSLASGLTNLLGLAGTNGGAAKGGNFILTNFSDHTVFKAGTNDPAWANNYLHATNALEVGVPNLDFAFQIHSNGSIYMGPPAVATVSSNGSMYFQAFGNRGIFNGSGDFNVGSSAGTCILINGQSTYPINDAGGDLGVAAKRWANIRLSGFIATGAANKAAPFNAFTNSGGTPFNWTNTTGTNLFVFVDDGGVTGTISVNGQQIFSLGTSTSIPLQPNEWVTLTFTVGTPAMRAKPY